MEEQKHKRFPVIPAALCSLLLLGSAAYGMGLYYYQSHFLNGTVVDQVDVSGMTIDELKAQTENYCLKVEEQKQDGSVLEEEIAGKDIDLSYASTEPLEELLKSQNSFRWFMPGHAEHNTEGLITYDENKLTSEVQGLRGFEADFFAEPTDAYIADYDKENGFAIVPETEGNALDFQKTLEAVKASVEQLGEQVNLKEAGCYKAPEVTSEDEQLLAAQKKLQKYADTTITYTFGENQEVLDGEQISAWLTVDGADVSLDQSQVESYVAELRKKYDTIFRPRTFKTTYGTEIKINSGDYGWWMDSDQEAVELAQMIERGESGPRTPVYRQTAAAYGAQDYGSTYVEINLTAQHLYLYKDGKQILESDFVSGNSSRGYDTPAGVYSVTYKQRDATLKGENYRTPVSYWMPFNLNIGMHDANWRSSFGGNIYKTNGSHGCINLPPSIAKQIYENIEKGTAVICYYMPGTEPKERVPEPETPPAEEGTTPETPPAEPGAEQPVPELVPEPVPAPEPAPAPEPVPEPVPVPEPAPAPEP